MITKKARKLAYFGDLLSSSLLSSSYSVPNLKRYRLNITSILQIQLRYHNNTFKIISQIRNAWVCQVKCVSFNFFI